MHSGYYASSLQEKVVKKLVSEGQDIYTIHMFSNNLPSNLPILTQIGQ